jgi:hypothetical protein
MRELVLSICFEDKDGNIICKRQIESKWEIVDEATLKKYHNVNIMDEIAEVITDQLKLQLTSDIIKEMIKEVKGGK